MTEIIKIINSVSDLIIALSLIFFIYFIYNENGKIKKLSIFERLFVRIALSFGASGCLYDFLTYSNDASFMVHLSFAMIFIWGAYFHYKYFIKK